MAGIGCECGNTIEEINKKMYDYYAKNFEHNFSDNLVIKSKHKELIKIDKQGSYLRTFLKNGDLATYLQVQFQTLISQHHFIEIQETLLEQ
jgi:hypothetical protein